MIIAVSDVHLAEHADDPLTRQDDEQFISFLGYIRDHQLSEGGKLVLLGDLVDYWRRDFPRALIDSESAFKALMELSRSVEVHYIVGNHDYHNLSMSGLLKDRFPLGGVREWDTIPAGDQNFFFMHGYQLEVLANPYYKSLTTYETFSEHLCLGGDDTGNAASTVWDLYQSSRSWLEGLKKLPKDIQGSLCSMMNTPDKRLKGSHESISAIDALASSAARCVYLGTDRNDILVFGHTHEPFKDMQRRVINVGSWRKSPCKAYTFLEIADDGTPRLMEFIATSENGAVRPLDPVYMKRNV